MLPDRFGEHDECVWTDSNQSGVCGLCWTNMSQAEASAQYTGLKGSAANMSVSHTEANLQKNPGRQNWSNIRPVM